MSQFNRRVITVVAYTLVVLALRACVPIYKITIYNGSIDPPTLEINEGDVVFWVNEDANGDSASLATTDAVARIGLPGADETKEQICGAVAGGSSEPVTSVPEVNFSGPKRKGISGIHVLAPQGFGYIETSTSDLSATCNDVLDPDKDRNVRYETVRSMTDTDTGTLHLLCSKEVKEVRVVDGEVRVRWVPGKPAGDETQGAISQVVPSVWDNPDIDGVVLRVRWKDFQYYDRASASVVTVWDDIDREFREAIKRGKMISINIHAGEDTPSFIFNDYVPDDPHNDEPVCAPPNPSRPLESNVEPVCLRDFGSDSDPPSGCGRPLKLGSPNDPNYVDKIEGLYVALAEHVKADARFFQALGYVKVSGLNLTTGEARLPKSCLDPDAGTTHPCLCNTQIWAGADLDQPLTYDYTPTGLYTFYHDIENQIFTAFMGEKSLHYMLIQAGFPRVKDEANYFRDRDHLGDDRMPGGGDDGPVGTGFPDAFEQTETVLEDGRLGRFASAVYPAPADDPATGKLFVAQHSGLSVHPQDRVPPAPICPQTVNPITGAPLHVELTDANGKIYYDVYTDGVPALGEPGSGCPNPWAAEQGYLGQLIGFQTMNTVDDPNEVDSSLWNMMSASNAAYYEIYEDAAWVIDKEKGHGPDAAVLDELGYFPRQGQGREYQKNLHQWGQQLHQRREKLASVYAASYPHMADPYPPAHFHVFSEPLDPGEVRDFYYINPGTCMGWDRAQPYGHIRVTGQ